MARAKKSTQPASRLSVQVHRALREGALYVFGALAFILWFALFTYDPSDPGFSQATAAVEVQNGIGRVGALTADVKAQALDDQSGITRDAQQVDRLARVDGLGEVGAEPSVAGVALTVGLAVCLDHRRVEAHGDEVVGLDLHELARLEPGHGDRQRGAGDLRGRSLPHGVPDHLVERRNEDRTAQRLTLVHQAPMPDSLR